MPLMALKLVAEILTQFVMLVIISYATCVAANWVSSIHDFSTIIRNVARKGTER